MSDPSDLESVMDDFYILYRAAEGALVQAQLDGYDTAHLRDLATQLQRLAPGMGLIEAMKASRVPRVENQEAGE